MTSMTLKLAGGAVAAAFTIGLGMSGALAAAHAAKPAMSVHKDFSNSLGTHYEAMATEERLELDAADDAHFSAKAAMANKGFIVMPDLPNSRVIEDASHRAYAASAHQRLMKALGSDAPSKHPLVMADAQAAYDCYLQEAEEGYQLLHVQNCRTQLETALATINKPTQVVAAKPVVKAAAKPIQNITFTVYFDFDSAALKQEAQPTLQQAIAEFKRRNNARVDLAGHTDRAGSTEYNRALSKRRADAVANALSTRGVTSGRIDDAALGELAPEVPTQDGVREPLNRRVVIVVSSQ
ncbi:MAG: OmpA family protein [Minwuia sp.]|nr:OmpA family protein [Minwuia sp.]